MSNLNVDYYVGTLHKWAYSCKGTGFLWIDSRHREYIHLIATSKAHNMSFPREFQHLGSNGDDACTKFIASSVALDFYNRFN